MKFTLSLIICAVLMIFGIDASSQSLNIPLITVNESATEYAKVDEIHFSVRIQSHEQEIKDAREKNRVVAQSIFELLKKEGVPTEYIQTQRMSIRRNYVRNRQLREYDGFIAYQDIYVCLRAIEKYDGLVDELLEMDIESLSGPIFKSRSYEETLMKAKLNAMKKARKSAEEMAAVLGQSIGKAKLISSGSSSNRKSNAYSNEGDGTNASGSSGNSFEIGEISVTSTIQISFELNE